MGLVKIYDEKQKKEITYHMNDRLKVNIDNKVKPALNLNDKDYVIVIDGGEGSGKSTLAMQLGKYIDPTLDLSRVVFSAEEFKEAIYRAKKGQVVIYDEAFTGLSSRASLSGINRFLVSLMMQMRQKNLCVIVVLPTFFLLDRYVALFRAKILIHVYENHGIRGYFRLFNSRLKKQLYPEGKKLFTYPIKTNFKGRFYGVFALGDKEIEIKYRKKKEKALEDSEKNPMTGSQVKYRDQRNLWIYFFKKYTGMTYENMAQLAEDYDMHIGKIQILTICNAFGDPNLKKDAAGRIKVPKIDDNAILKASLDESNGNDTEKDKIEPENARETSEIP